MNNITEEKLLFLKFKKQNVSAEESGSEAYHYYSLDIRGLCLISNSNDECIDGKYMIELLDYYELGKFRDIKKLNDFINIVKSLKK